MFPNQHPVVGKNKFFDATITALRKHFDGDMQSHWKKVSCVVVGSPGFTRENFLHYLRETSERKNSSFLKSVVSKVILSHCSSGFKQALKEILSD